MNKSSLLTIIIILLCIACNSDNETTTSAVEVDLQPKDSSISLNAIFGKLEGKVSYNDIKLAIAFIS